MMKKNILLNSIAVIAAFIVTILFAVCLAITIKYAYIDEISHYHTDTCYINSCTSTITQCCEQTKCTCYNIHVNYYLYLNNTNYTKSSQSTVYNPNYCNKNSINCYYDDRNIQDTLRSRVAYNPNGGLIGIVLLSLGLFMMIIVLIGTMLTVFNCAEKQQAIEENYNQEN